MNSEEAPTVGLREAIKDLKYYNPLSQLEDYLYLPPNAVDGIMALIEADRERYITEARIDELSYFDDYQMLWQRGRQLPTEKPMKMSVADRIKELKEGME